MGSPLGSPDDPAGTGRAVRDMFSAIAHRYDFLNHFLSLGRDIAWRRAAAQAMRDVVARPGSVALDLCCGTGDLALELAGVSRGKVLGADFCRPMLVLAAKKTADAAPPASSKANGSGLRQEFSSPIFLEADALALPFADGSLDLVTSAFGFRNLANYRRGLEEIRRVLKPGGLVAILEFSRVRWPVFGPVFRFYFRHVLRRLGTMISGVEGPYQYLPESVAKFPDQEQLAAALGQAGFGKVWYRNFSGGVAALHVGEKA